MNTRSSWSPPHLSVLRTCFVACLWSGALGAQTRGTWLDLGVGYDSPLPARSIRDAGLISGTVGTSIGDVGAFAFGAEGGAAGATPVSSDHHRDATRFAAGGELRLHMIGGSPAQPECYLIAGASALRAQLSGTSPALGPQLTAGLGLAFPFVESTGLEVRAAAGWDHLPATQVELLPDPRRAVWTPWFRFAVRVFLRPVARTRRIPPQTMPDASNTTTQASPRDRQVTSASSFGRLDTPITDRATPDASAGGVLPPNYVRTQQEMSTSKTRGHLGHKRSRIVLADTVGAIAQSLLDSASVHDSLPHLASHSSSHLRTDRPTGAAHRSTTVDDALVSVPDSVLAALSDSAWSHLRIRPAQIDGRVRPLAMIRVAHLLADRAQRLRLAVRVIADTSSTDHSGSVRARASTTALFHHLLAAGVPPRQVTIGSESSPPNSGPVVSILIHADPAPIP